MREFNVMIAEREEREREERGIYGYNPISSFRVLWVAGREEKKQRSREESVTIN